MPWQMARYPVVEGRKTTEVGGGVATRQGGQRVSGFVNGRREQEGRESQKALEQPLRLHRTTSIASTSAGDSLLAPPTDPLRTDELARSVSSALESARASTGGISCASTAGYARRCRLPCC
jgi:hypothetical protein